MNRLSFPHSGEGHSTAQLAKHFNRHASTIKRLKRNILANKPAYPSEGNRKPIITPYQQQQLVRANELEPFDSFVQLHEKSRYDCHMSTVRRVLNSQGLRSYICRVDAAPHAAEKKNSPKKRFSVPDAMLTVISI